RRGSQSRAALRSAAKRGGGAARFRVEVDSMKHYAEDGDQRDVSMTSSLSLPESFGKYRVARQIGQGGMGSVWLAQDTLLKRLVALKVPHLNNSDDPDPIILARFKREAQAAAALHHPNLCPVYEVGEIAGIHYIAMAYIEGCPLAEFIHPGQPFPQRQAAALVSPLAYALHEAHRLGIVHRGLKPKIGS